MNVFGMALTPGITSAEVIRRVKPTSKVKAYRPGQDLRTPGG